MKRRAEDERFIKNADGKKVKRNVDSQVPSGPDLRQWVCKGDRASLQKLKEQFLAEETSGPSRSTIAFFTANPGIEDQLVLSWANFIHVGDSTACAILPTVASLILKESTKHQDMSKYGKRIIAKLLNESHIRNLYKNLASSKSFVLLPTCRLLVDIANHDGGSSCDLFSEFDFSLKSLSNILDVRRDKDKKAASSLRKTMVRFLLLIFEHGDAKVKFSIVMQRQLMMPLFKHLDLDDADLIKDVLVMLKVDVLRESLIPRNAKAGLITDWVLQRLKSLLLRIEDVNYGLEKVTLREVAFDVLLCICTGPTDSSNKAGVPTLTTKHYSLAADRVLRFLSATSPLTSVLHQEFLLRILEANPELLIPFTKDYKTSLEPKLSVGWLTQMGFFTRLIGLPFRPLSLTWKKSLPPNQDIIEHILPQPFAKQLISKALQHESNLVRYSASNFLLGSLRKLEEVLRFIDESELTQDDVRYDLLDLYSQRIPDLQTLAARYMIAVQPALLKATFASSIELYQILLPELSYATKLDIASLLVQSLTVKHIFSSVETKALMGLFDKSDIQWLRQSSNGVSFFSQILRRFINNVDNTMLKRVEEFTKTRLVFRGDSVVSPLQPILLSFRGLFAFLPAEESTSLLEFFDACLCRSAQNPYKYIDSAMVRIDGRFVTASPFFATICEQASIRFRLTDYSPSHHQTVIGWMFEIGYLLALSGESGCVIRRLLEPFALNGFSDSSEESLIWLENARNGVRGNDGRVVGYLSDSPEIFELILNSSSSFSSFWLVTLLQRIRIDIKAFKPLTKVSKLFHLAASSPQIDVIQKWFLDEEFWDEWYLRSKWLDHSILFSEFVEEVCIHNECLDHFMSLVMKRLPLVLKGNDLDGCFQPIVRCANLRYTTNLLSEVVSDPMTTEKTLRKLMQCAPVSAFEKEHLGHLIRSSTQWKDGTETVLAHIINNIPWDIWQTIRDDFKADNYVFSLHLIITEALFNNSSFLKTNIAAIHGILKMSASLFNTLFDFHVEMTEGVVKWTGSETTRLCLARLARLAQSVRKDSHDVSLLSRVCEVSLLDNFLPETIKFQEINLLQRDACRLLRISARNTSHSVLVQCCTHIADQLTRHCVQEDDLTIVPDAAILGVFEQITIQSSWKFTDYVSETTMDALLQSMLPHYAQAQVLEAAWVCILQLDALHLVHHTRLLQLVLSNPVSSLSQGGTSRLRYLETLIIERLFSFDSKRHANASIVRQIMQKYGGTCCASDFILLCILQKVEETMGKSLADFVSDWKLDKNADDGFITAGLNGLRISIDSERLLHTVFHYPSGSSKVEIHEFDARIDETRGKLYNPTFMLPALCKILRQGSEVKIGKFIDLHGFVYMVASLSHSDHEVRKMSQGMLNFCAHNLENYARDQIPLTLLIGSLRAVLSHANRELPLFVSLFFGLSAHVLLQPLHVMHQRLLQVYSKQSMQPTNAIPLFFTVQNVNSSDFTAEMCWVLKILRTGYRMEDAIAYHRMHVIQICMSMFRAPRLPRKLTEELRKTIKNLTEGSVYGMRAYIRQDAAFSNHLVD